jgi:hypothetical protein
MPDLLQVALPLLCGLAIYVLLRPDLPPFFRMVVACDAEPMRLMGAFREQVQRAAPGLPFVYQLPSALWTYSLTWAVAVVWSGSASNYRNAWLVAVLAFCVGFEVAQRFHLVQGTFDPRDVAATVLGWLLAVLAVRCRRQDVSCD